MITAEWCREWREKAATATPSSFKLLNVGNAKTSKGEKLGYMTGVLYLAPYSVSGYQVCPFAELAGCWQGCLNTSGHGGMAKDTMSPFGVAVPDNVVQAARIARTRWLMEDREGFVARLRREIDALIRRAHKLDMVPVVRLNGTSDLPWHAWKFDGETIFDSYPEIQFYDYTKVVKNWRASLMIDNYHVVVSYSEASPMYRKAALDAHAEGAPLVAVCESVSVAQELGEEIAAGCLVDGDEHDLRFLDERSPVRGALIYLYPKARAKQDFSGFVVRR